MRFFTLALALACLILLPAQSQAAEASFFGPIVPAECRCESEVNIDTGELISTAPDYGCVLQTVQNAINFAVSLSIIMFVAFLVIASFGLIASGGNPQALNKAKTRLLNIVIGLAVFLCAWLIVDFIMKTLYNEQGTFFGPWNAILAGESGTRCIIARNPSALTTGSLDIEVGTPTSSGGPITGGGGGVTTSGTLDDRQARTALTSNGVVITNWAATRSLANTRQDTINQTIEIKRACGCTVQVNATTGGTHSTRGIATHANGYKVDLQINSGLDSFLKRLQYAGKRGNDSLYKDSCGNTYAREAGNPGHWDISVTQGVCRLSN